MRRTMVAGNWKMHGTRASVAELIDGLRQSGPAERC
jgi:triosephosphate isomerase (TIM)